MELAIYCLLSTIIYIFIMFGLDKLSNKTLSIERLTVYYVLQLITSFLFYFIITSILR